MGSETWPLLSRVADSVYWMARYIERAENVARVIEVNLHLQLDLPSTAANLWQALIDTSGDTQFFGDKYGPATHATVIKFLAQDATNPNSIVSCLRTARENARSVRETISSEMWEQVNSMYLQMLGQWDMLESAHLPEVFRGIRLASHMFQGITDATMSHNEAWHFTCLGRQMERADKTSRLLDVKYFMLLPSASSVGTPYDDLHWAAVLKSVSGFEMYRKKHGHIAPHPIVEFLVLDRDFPRSIQHSISGADECLHAITGTPRGSFRYRTEQGLGMLKAELDFTSVDRIIRDGLHEYLDRLQVKMNAIGDALVADFFATSPLAEAVSSGSSR
jgi:uncharacterized alpha-E superfamily protein